MDEKNQEKKLPKFTLSHSKMMKAAECGEAYHNHYDLRLRPRAESAALLFGSAIDAGLSAMLGPEQKNPYESFDYWWNFQEIKKKLTPLARCIDIVYAKSDFDIDLLEDVDYETLKAAFGITVDIRDAIATVFDEKSVMGFHGLPDDRKEFLNYCNWLCLRRKGYYMIAAIIEKVVPNIEEVLGTQVQVDLENEDGDKIIGFADLVVRWKGLSKPVILDWKTSSIEYDNDAVLVSPQLSLYTYALGPIYGTDMAGFIILSKRMLKDKIKVCSVCGNDGAGKSHRTCDAEVDGQRCKGAWNSKSTFKAKVDIMIDKIPEQAINIVLENMTLINRFIKNGEFHRNLTACKKSWGVCPFFNRCWKGNSSDLIQLEETNAAIPFKAQRR